MPENVSWFRRLCLTGGVVVVALVALLPWWRHHAYLRDFYDYGLVMSGVGRIAGGERPYVDFVTPIQTGTFLFNGWAERAGGGTYQGMTLGAAVHIVLTVLLLAFVFSRRWPAGIALLCAAAFTIMSVSQHTIIWHNSLGAVLVVVVAWAAAFGPVWRRASWGWTALVCAALFVGGLNKLNAHLVALACAAAWTLRAGFRREAGWGAIGLALATWLVAGVVAPVVFELAWTGASFSAWWHNVVAMPFESRAGDFGWVLRPELYTRIRHDYYGPLTLPWVGALGLAASAWFAVVAWRAATRGSERVWGVAAALFAAGAGAGLLATNYEIAWVALAAWLGLIAALWAGFGLPARGVAFWIGVAGPLALVGAAAGESAWRGQRSQFGYSTTPRAAYRDAGDVHAEFAYLRGTRVPPEVAQTMNEAMLLRWHIPEMFRAKVFYGPGVEWLERVWPAVKVQGLPLWMHGGTSYGAKEENLLLEHLQRGSTFDYIFVTEVRDHWGMKLGPEIRRGFQKEHFGQLWFIYRALPPGVVSADPFAFAREFGGNADSTQLLSTMRTFALADGRKFLGVTEGSGKLTLRAACYRMVGEGVIRRRAGAPAGPIRVRFGAYAMEGSNLFERGSFDAELPAGETEKAFTSNIDPGGVPMLFTVTVPPELAGQIEAGWRGPRLLHTVDGPEEPPLLVPGAFSPVTVGDKFLTSLLPVNSPARKVVIRGSVAALDDGLELLPGAEVWVRLEGGHPDIDLLARAAGPLNPDAQPVLRIIYYKGGRLDTMTQEAIRTTDPLRLHAWSAEADGWLGILFDRNFAVPPVRLKITQF